MARIAGQNRRAADGMHVDYADVLRQAVDNERWRVLREVRRTVDSLGVTKEGRDSFGYAQVDSTAKEFRRGLIRALDQIEAAP